MMSIDNNFIKRLKYNRVKQEVLKIRELKNESIKNQLFEKAAYYRDIEKTLLDQVGGEIYIIG